MGSFLNADNLPMTLERDKKRCDQYEVRCYYGNYLPFSRFYEPEEFKKKILPMILILKNAPELFFTNTDNITYKLLGGKEPFEQTFCSDIMNPYYSLEHITQIEVKVRMDTREYKVNLDEIPKNRQSGILVEYFAELRQAIPNNEEFYTLDLFDLARKILN